MFYRIAYCSLTQTYRRAVVVADSLVKGILAGEGNLVGNLVDTTITIIIMFV